MAYRLSPEAEEDLDEIWLYVARASGSVDIANRLIDTVTDRCWLLGTRPWIGRRRDHDLRAGLRTFVSGEYVIVCRVEGEDAALLRIIRGSRDVEALLQK